MTSPLTQAIEAARRATNFEPVRTKDDLDSLSLDEIVEGYASAERGDPEPGLNRGRAFWHGWCNRMRDYGVLPMDEASAQLAREVVKAAP
jgi:hypothetical protein